jgi:osmotically-inducible protein OsmY
MSRIATLLFGAAIGAAAIRLLANADNRRRLIHAANQAKGAVATATPSMPGHGPSDPDDVTLARKVETEIFRDANAPKGDVSVDVQGGVAYLRGAVADEAWIARLVDDAKKVDGIKGVNNLLHAPGTPAPAAEPRGAVRE